MGSVITFKQTGNFRKTERFMRKASDLQIQNVLQKYGDLGVEYLRKATPKDSGTTADSWDYTIELYLEGYKIYWTNSNIKDGWACVALLLQYGHATGTGGYVEGIDYINPALNPIFTQLANNAWKEVTKFL